MCLGKDGVWPGERLGGHELHCLQVVQEDTLCVGRSGIRSAPVMGSVCSLPQVTLLRSIAFICGR